MELRPSDEQDQLIDAFGALYAKASSPERVRDTEASGFDRSLWEQLAEIGAVPMGVPEEHGGWGASLLDLALVAEQHGRHLGSAPLVEAQVAARLLARAGEPGAATLRGVLEDGRVVVFAPRPARGKVATMAPGAAVADAIVVLVDGDLLVAHLGDNRVAVENLGSMSVADVSVGEVEVLATGDTAATLFEGALDEWLVLTGASLGAIAKRSLEIGVDYAKERYAFGQAIGAFQAVAHPLADSAAAADGAQLLSRQAAWAADTDPARFAQLAAMSFAFSAETARDASYRALHLHGGYGFMLEYDIQLYYRRARGWANVGMSAAQAYRRAGSCRLEAADTQPAAKGGAVEGGMDFRVHEGEAELRAEVRAFLDEHLTPDLEAQMHETGVSHDADFTRALAEKRWIAPGWPIELGGAGLGLLERISLMEELLRAEAPIYGVGTSYLVASVLKAVGTDAQRTLIPKALAGEIIMVLGFTEPEVGSDLASAVCRAVPDGDQWVINGQKMFTTNAQVGDYVFLLARTNTEVPKHKGLTMFVVPLDQPGVEVQPVFTMSGERTNITFYNDVRVDDAWRIGEVDGGWRTLSVALAEEHGGGFSPALDRLLGAVESWTRDPEHGVDDNGVPLARSADVQELIGHTAASLEVSRLLHRRVAWMAEEGIPVVAEGPMSKLLSSEELEDRAEQAIEVLGPDALRSFLDPTAPARGLVEHVLRFSLGTTIYAGTSEVHRNMIAQRGLGLPRPG